MFKTLEELGNPAIYLVKEGFSADMLAKLGGIAVVSANIESTLEKAFISLSGGKFEEELPAATKLVFRFRQLNKSKPSKYNKVIDHWCGAAFIYLSCRNSIIHGEAIRFEDTILFSKSRPIDGVKRRQKYSDFHGNSHTLALFLNAGTLLSRVINIINFSFTEEMEYSEDLLISAIQNARSTCAELDDLAAAVNSEKY